MLEQYNQTYNIPSEQNIYSKLSSLKEVKNFHLGAEPYNLIHLNMN